MDTIRIIGLGAGSFDDLTVKAYNVLKENVPTFLRTERHPSIDDFKKNNIKFDTFDNFFEKIEDFAEIFTEIVEKILAELKKYGKINYCVPGSPLMGDTVTDILLKNYSDKINIEVIDGQSFLDKCIKLSGYADFKNINIVTPNDIDEFSFNVNALNIISHVESRSIASDVKLKLLELYPENLQIFKIDVFEEKCVKMPLFSIDQHDGFEFSIFFCILPIEISEITVYNIENLCRIVKELRGPNGCPWDIKQTHESCKNNLAEEAQEVIDAIDNEDFDNLCEELGDLLLQVVFHSEMASEEGYFNLNDVITGSCSKLIRRHPHVFGDDIALTPEDAVKIWKASKEKEKNNLS